jgi:hypothetical protein
MPIRINYLLKHYLATDIDIYLDRNNFYLIVSNLIGWRITLSGLS